jgi:transposase
MIFPLYSPRPELEVLLTLIPKRACEGAPECGVKEAARPEGLIEGNRYDTSVATEIITAKNGFHLPICRQQDYFAGSGWTPGRSTLLNILVAAAAYIRPFVLYLRNDLDVWAYVKEVLDRPLAGDRDYAALRPDRWAAAHPEHIRVYRAEERRDRADAQRTRRADRRRAATPRD